jgi:hypothetical protein
LYPLLKVFLLENALIYWTSIKLLEKELATDLLMTLIIVVLGILNLMKLHCVNLSLCRPAATEYGEILA